MVTITLPDDIEAWARAEVAAGRARSIEEFVMSWLRERRASNNEHRALVLEAYESVAQGRVHDGADVDAELDRWIAEDLAAAQR
jgi:hypothetical protein